MSRLRATHNELSEGTRAEMVEVLNRHLATALHLSLHGKLAHWNVRGPTFMMLHALFDDVHAAAMSWADLLAERAVQLGGDAEGSLSSIQERTKLPVFDLGTFSSSIHTDRVASCIAAFGRRVRASVEVAERAEDPGTADLLTQISRAADEMLWKVEAHGG